MLGYVTKKRAKEMGFEHYVKLFGVLPSYARNLGSGCPEVLGAHPIFDFIDVYVISPFVITLQWLMGHEPSFGFKVIGDL